MSNPYTERNYPTGWQRALYRWTLASELIHAGDMERTLAAAGRLDHGAVVWRREIKQQWDRANHG